MIPVQRIFSDKRRLIVPLAVAVLANIVLFAVVVFPLGRQVGNAEEGMRSQREILRRARADYQTAKATVQGKQRADAALQKFYKDVLPTSSIAAIKITYTRLQQIASQANVHLERGVNEVRKEKGSSLSQMVTSYTLSGDYRDVRKFIYSLETAPEFMVLENVALSNSEQAQRGLTVAIQVSTYFQAPNGD
jgi:type IV pilus assembly protein PilO